LEVYISSQNEFLVLTEVSFLDRVYDVAHMGEERGVYRVLVGKPEGKNHWGDLGIDGWIILGWISRRWDVGIWTGLGWSRLETGGGHL